MATDMATDTIRVSAIIPAPPERIYSAWLDSAEHSAITKSTATVEPWVGGRHSAWGGSIRGTTLDLQPNRRIVQSWWASDFPPGSEESRLEVLFEPVEGGTLVTINHTGLPLGRGHRYEEGWKDFYLDHMKEYFAAHPESPPREESPAPGRMSTESSAPRPALQPAAARPGAARARKPATKKGTRARQAAAKKAARPARKRRKPAAKRPKARAKAKPARARRKPARKAAPKARKSTRRAGGRRGR